MTKEVHYLPNSNITPSGSWILSDCFCERRTVRTAGLGRRNDFEWKTRLGLGVLGVMLMVVGGEKGEKDWARWRFGIPRNGGWPRQRCTQWWRIGSLAVLNDKETWVKSQRQEQKIVNISCAVTVLTAATILVSQAHCSSLSRSQSHILSWQAGQRHGWIQMSFKYITLEFGADTHWYFDASTWSIQ